ncbi:hypothetical protein BUALT_Bualt08G0036700 [Buddleja alternifolia]|uniref:Rad60/SUMO-like domain-containing protein n=1 Tax=Buddleja alternifolia TaxID=168488 RepID=A0AAV6X3F0_9LAMI|nr:hypothetical protein BUALT_Bualt08G0036700 [Buddleja alternifolia]
MVTWTAVLVGTITDDIWRRWGDEVLSALLLDVIDKSRVSRLDMEEKIQKLAKWIKRSTQLKKLMNAYCDRQSVDFNSIVLFFDARLLRAEQTPDEATSHDDFRVLGVRYLFLGFCCVV